MYPESYEIYIKLVVDQINVLASMARSWHAALELYNKNINAPDKEKNKASIRLEK